MKVIIRNTTFLLVLALGIQEMKAQHEALANVSVSESINALIQNETIRDAAVLSAIQMKELQKAEPMTAVLDTRCREAYELGKVYRAKHMGQEFSLEKIWMLNRDNPIIVYGDDVEKNQETCKLLMEKGFKKVFFLNDTLGELELQGVNVEGDSVKSDKVSAGKKGKKK